jgi:A/G-specific adenine glycosylase
VLVSEVMLQQTQAERVRPHHERFVAAFPTPAALASAPMGDAIRAWAGLGYNRRAVNLHRAASAIVERHGGRVPREPEELRALPGVGPYTASAVACFAFGRAVPVVDTNVRRVIARHRLGVEPREASDRAVAAAATEVLPHAEASAWSQAVMDLAREVCVSRPRCEACPIAADCAYRLAGCAPLRAPNGRGQPAFEGSVRQARGRAVALLRSRGSASLFAVAAASGLDLPAAVRLVGGLEADGLCVASPAARTGSPRGRVRLP